uniref:ICOS ligand n=1 Tax=Sarcophilus harrisii TaxID=9305 RepID=A0A7N4UX43_SARHA
MTLKSIGFFLFLLGCLRAAVMEEIYGMVGGDVDLSCISPGKKHFDLNKISVYWQTKNEPLKTINAYIPGDDTSQYIDSKYQNRTSLKLEKMERGDFSLHLSNITIKDELELECIVVNKSSTDPLFRSTVNLHVAANYSIPVVEAPKKTNDTEVTFTCTSHNGFPKPKIYWVNKTDNSLLNQSLQNDTFTINEKGLYSVSSVLKIAWTPNIRVECCIENVNLQQNLTVQSSFLLSPDGSTDHRIITTTPNQSIPSGKTSIITFFIIFGIVLVILLMAVISFRKLRKNKHHYGDYRGPQGNRQMAETTGKEKRN